MPSAATSDTIRIAPRPRIETAKDLPDNESSASHYGEWKLKEQWGWAKKFGLGTIFLVITGVASTTIAIEQLVSPAVGQAKWNGATNTRLDAIATTQKDNDERQARLQKEAEDRLNKALLDGLGRVESAVGGQGVKIDAMKMSTDNALGQLRQDTMGLWKWATALDGRIGILEAEIKNKSKEK